MSQFFWFSRVSMRNWLWSYLRLVFIYLAFRKRKKGSNIRPKIILVLGFCPRETKISRSPIGTSQKKSFLTTPNVENKFCSSRKTLESTGETKLKMKFYLLCHNFSDFSNLFSRVSMRNCLCSYLRLELICLAFRKSKKGS